MTAAAVVTMTGLAAGWRPAAGRSQWENCLDSDSRLVARCLAGDDAAWEELVKAHSRRVYAICYRFTGRASEAEEITQEVFLRVFQTLKSFRMDEGQFSVWLTRLARNLLIDHYRREKMQRVTDSIEDQLPEAERLAPQRERTDGLVESREHEELIQAGLRKLAPELRETVILRDMEELDYKAIAEVLRVPEGTVKSRLHRGRAELAKVLRRSRVIV